MSKKNLLQRIGEKIQERKIDAYMHTEQFWLDKECYTSDPYASQKRSLFAGQEKMVAKNWILKLGDYLAGKKD